MALDSGPDYDYSPINLDDPYCVGKYVFSVLSLTRSQFERIQLGLRAKYGDNAIVRYYKSEKRLMVGSKVARRRRDGVAIKAYVTAVLDEAGVNAELVLPKPRRGLFRR